MILNSEYMLWEILRDLNSYPFGTRFKSNAPVWVGSIIEIAAINRDPSQGKTLKWVQNPDNWQSEEDMRNGKNNFVGGILKLNGASIKYSWTILD